MSANFPEIHNGIQNLAYGYTAPRCSPPPGRPVATRAQAAFTNYSKLQVFSINTGQKCLWITTIFHCQLLDQRVYRPSIIFIDLEPLRSGSDQYPNSSYNITARSKVQDMRMKKLINNDDMS